MPYRRSLTIECRLQELVALVGLGAIQRPDFPRKLGISVPTVSRVPRFARGYAIEAKPTGRGGAIGLHPSQPLANEDTIALARRADRSPRVEWAVETRRCEPIRFCRPSEASISSGFCGWLNRSTTRMPSRREKRSVGTRVVPWAAPRNLNHLKYETLLLVLSDLMGQGWRTRFRQRSIFLST